MLIEDPVKRVSCEVTELAWTVEVDGVPAGLHRLAGGTPGLDPLRGRLPRWSVTTEPWARGLDWKVELEPRVLRPEHPGAGTLGVDGSAAALLLRETALLDGRRVEHELLVLAQFAEPAGRAWRAHRAAAAAG